MTPYLTSTRENVINVALKLLLEAQIAEESDLPCKATTLTAQAILELKQYSDCTLDKEQTKALNYQKFYLS